MRCKEVILNAIVSGGTTSTASVFRFSRQVTLKFVIYDVVSFCWRRKRLVISHHDPNFPGKESRNTYFFLSMLM